MKKRIYPYGIGTILGRFYTLFILGILPLAMVVYSGVVLYKNISDINLIVGLLGLILFIFAFIGSIFLEKIFWYQFWSVLTITKDCITWSCPFYKTVSLPIDEIKYSDVRTFDAGNVCYNPSNPTVNGYRFVLLSDKPLPNKRIDKIISSHKLNLIKFPMSYRLCLAINNVRPQNKLKFAEYYLYLYRKSGKG